MIGYKNTVCKLLMLEHNPSNKLTANQPQPLYIIQNADLMLFIRVICAVK